MKAATSSTCYLQQAIQDSRLLIAYAAQSGIPVDEAVLETLVNAQYAAKQDIWPSQEEAAFWKAFNTVTQLVQPVTIESLHTVSLVDANEVCARRRFSFFRRAYRSVLFYILFAIVAIGLLLATQAYWLIGTKLLNNIDQLSRRQTEIRQFVGYAEGEYQAEDETLQMIIETNRAILVLWSKLWQDIPFIGTSSSEEKTFGKEDYQAAIDVLQERLKITVGKLRYARDFSVALQGEGGGELADLYQRQVETLTEQLILKNTEYVTDKNDYQRREIELRDQYVLQVLQSYVLPLLYGLLGAVAYVLRGLIRNIHRATYTSQAAINYGVRIFLGALAGPVIGYFITPEGTTGLGSLSPMALSFLVGYNIELLFTAMDKIMMAVSKKPVEAPLPASMGKGNTHD
jgi:hypothetical protein